MIFSLALDAIYVLICWFWWLQISTEFQSSKLKIKQDGKPFTKWMQFEGEYNRAKTIKLEDNLQQVAQMQID